MGSGIENALLVCVNLLPILALSLAIRPTRFTIPWLGLATVVMGTTLAFSSSATFYSDRSIGAGIGWLITSIYGFVGLGIVVAYVRLRPTPFVPLGAIVAGVIHIASFYVYLPPFAVDSPTGLTAAAPGFLLIAYGAYLWYRHGLAESLEHRSLVLRLIMALVVVAGLGILGFLQYEGPRPHKWLARTPNLPRMAEESTLVVEGIVVHKELFKNKGSKKIRYTFYEMDVIHFWRGFGPAIINFAVPEYSPVEMSVGQSYLIFSGGMVRAGEIPSHWRLLEPSQAWPASDGKFYPYPGLPREAPITRDFVTKLLESTPYSSE